MQSSSTGRAESGSDRLLRWRRDCCEIQLSVLAKYSHLVKNAQGPKYSRIVTLSQEYSGSELATSRSGREISIDGLKSMQSSSTGRAESGSDRLLRWRRDCCEIQLSVLAKYSHLVKNAQGPKYSRIVTLSQEYSGSELATSRSGREISIDGLKSMQSSSTGRAESGSDRLLRWRRDCCEIQLSVLAKYSHLVKNAQGPKYSRIVTLSQEYSGSELATSRSGREISIDGLKSMQSSSTGRAESGSDRLLRWRRDCCEIQLSVLAKYSHLVKNAQGPKYSRIVTLSQEYSGSELATSRSGREISIDGLKSMQSSSTGRAESGSDRLLRWRRDCCEIQLSVLAK